MLAVLAEFERDQVAERTKGSLAQLRNQGKRISGKIPYGYDLALDGESLVSNLKEQNGLQLIQRLRAQGLGRRRIATQLMKRVIPTKTGSSWSPQAVTSILHRAKVYHPTA